MTAASRYPAGLRRLAELYGVQTSYVGVDHQRQSASPEGLLAVLTALGAPLQSAADINTAISERQHDLASRLVQPVAVAWDGTPESIVIADDCQAELVLENGESSAISSSHRSLKFAQPLPIGYHRLRVRRGKRSDECLVVSAPTRCYTGEPGEPPGWGVFMPLYALPSKRSWAAGDFTDLGSLTDWTGSMGGNLVATLPLLAAFLDEPFEPSPYSPASRLFWNEFYLDVTAAPEFSTSEEAQVIVQSPEFQREIECLRHEPHVDYRRGMIIKRRVLAILAEQATQSSERVAQLHDFLTKRPGVDDYARFRAVTERRRESWHSWPGGLRDGRITDSELDEPVRFYHAYAQLLAHEQLSALRDGAAERGVRVYFDLPLGCNSGGYDVWRERDAFATRLSAGAPPDALFSLGQNWGFPPPHPENARLSGYRHWRAVLANMMRYGRALRIDHIMGLHRLYCIPHGMGAREGVYVSYPADELYAVLSLESHRHKAIVVGEDLGTVPRYVRPAMSRHAVHRTYVVQYEASQDGPLPSPHPMSVATLNTHDMPPFAAFWKGLDIDDRLDLGLLTEEQAGAEREDRRQLREALITTLRSEGVLKVSNSGAAEVLRALLVHLARSPARQTIINLEDLWLETQPQNVPGTVEERINWRRKAARSLEEFTQATDVLTALNAVNEARKREQAILR